MILRSGFDTEQHLATPDACVAELRSPHYPDRFVPLTEAGVKHIEGMIAKGGEVFGKWTLTAKASA